MDWKNSSMRVLDRSSSGFPVSAEGKIAAKANGLRSLLYNESKVSAKDWTEASAAVRKLASSLPLYTVLNDGSAFAWRRKRSGSLIGGMITGFDLVVGVFLKVISC